MVGNEPPDFMAESYGEVSPDGKDHYATVVKKLMQCTLAVPPSPRMT